MYIYGQPYKPNFTTYTIKRFKLDYYMCPFFVGQNNPLGLKFKVIDSLNSWHYTKFNQNIKQY